MPPKKKPPPKSFGSRESAVIVSWVAAEGLEAKSIRVMYYIVPSACDFYAAYVRGPLMIKDRISGSKRFRALPGDTEIEDVEALISELVKTSIDKAGGRAEAQSIDDETFSWAAQFAPGRREVSIAAAKGETFVKPGKEMGHLDLAAEETMSIEERVAARRELRMEMRRVGERPRFSHASKRGGKNDRLLMGERMQEAPTPTTHTSVSHGMGSLTALFKRGLSTADGVQPDGVSAHSQAVVEADEAKQQRKQKQAGWLQAMMAEGRKLFARLAEQLNPPPPPQLEKRIFEHYSAAHHGCLFSDGNRRAYANLILELVEASPAMLERLEHTLAHGQFYIGLLVRDEADVARLAIFRPDAQNSRLRVPTTYGSAAKLPVEADVVIPGHAWRVAFDSDGAAAVRQWHESHAFASIEDAVAVASNAAARPRARQLYHLTVLTLDGVEVPQQVPTSDASAAPPSQLPEQQSQVAPAAGPSSSALHSKMTTRVEVSAESMDVETDYSGLTDNFDGASWFRTRGHGTNGNSGGKQVIRSLEQPKEVVDQIVELAKLVAEAPGPVPEKTYRTLREATTKVAWADLKMSLLQDNADLTEKQIKVLLLSVEQTEAPTRAALHGEETLLHVTTHYPGKTINSVVDLYRTWPLAKAAEAKAKAASDAGAAARAAAQAAQEAATPQDAEGEDICFDTPPGSDNED